MIADAARIAVGCAWTNVGECAIYTRFGLQAAIVFERESRPGQEQLRKLLARSSRRGSFCSNKRPPRPGQIYASEPLRP
jgi:hypothetical protein